LTFDSDHFDRMTAGDRALQAEVLDLFRGQVETWRQVLRPDAPLQTWRDAAHTLKGSARGIGFGPLAEACATAEAAAGKPAAVIAAALDAVQAALTEALCAAAAAERAPAQCATASPAALGAL
jgi:HPt (histidine-containing phosphotransfer) domain-containing protein